MQSLWNDVEALQYPGELGQRIYSSRLLGRDKALVLHGGGNTSVKICETNILGDAEDILYVKGSGWDLEFIEEHGRVAGAAPDAVSDLAKKRQRGEMGTLGSGNHYLEVQVTWPPAGGTSG